MARRKRFKVGFYTARHPEFDEEALKARSHMVFLQKLEILAKDHSEALKLAKEQVDRDLLRKELLKRYPTAKFVGYTWQEIRKNAHYTWGRVEGQMRIVD